MGDDGSSGTVAGYDVRWTTTLMQPTGLAVSDDFFAASKAYAEASGITATSRNASRCRRSTVLLLRARERRGRQLLVADPRDAQDNLLTKQTLREPAHGRRRDRSLRRLPGGGQDDNDAFDDLVVGVDIQRAEHRSTSTTAQRRARTRRHRRFGPPTRRRPAAWGRRSPSATRRLHRPSTCSSPASATQASVREPGGAGIAVLYFGGAGAQNLDTSAANSFSSPA